MTVVNKQIAASADDCYETNDTTIDLTNTILYTGYPTGVYDTGLRWQSVNVSNGATISSAILSMYLVSDTGTLQATAKGIAEDNTATWSAGSRPSQRSKVGSVSANEADWGNWGIDNWITLNVTTIIQSIVNRAGWSANNALAIVLEDDAGVSSMYITSRSYNYAGNAHGAKLDVTFTEGRGTKNARQSMSVHSGVLFQTLTSGHGY